MTPVPVDPSGQVAPSSAVAGGGVLRQWVHPLGMLQAKLNRVVGHGALQLEFECSDEDFAMTMTSRWPQSTDQLEAHLLFDHVGLVRIAEALNELVRLYAIETGHTRLHVLLEARRGLVGVPPWWDDAPCLFATYGFDTQSGEVCIGKPDDVFDEMAWLAKTHRLLLAVGPAMPNELRGDGDEAWNDAEATQIRALQRWEQQLIQQLARLQSFTFGGGMMDEEAIVDALSTMRSYAGKVRRTIRDVTNRQRQKNTKPDEMEKADVSRAVREIKSVLQDGLASGAVPLPAKSILRRGLTSLHKLEADFKSTASFFEFRQKKLAQLKAPVKVKLRKFQMPKRRKHRRMKLSPRMQRRLQASFEAFYEEELNPEAAEPLTSRQRRHRMAPKG
ncbi:MAG: hypothetical protein AB7G06_01560 [Bdellovibrionales bacterium]